MSVAFLGLGLPLLFAVSLPLVQQTDTVSVTVPTDGGDGTGANGAFTCQTSQQRELQPHTERVWWLLAPNPFVIVADAAPRPAGSRADGTRGTVDPLSVIRVGVREARLGPPLVQNWGCPATVAGDGPGASFGDTDRARAAQRDAVGSVWPYGLGADLATGAGFLVVAVRRLRAPTRALPRGTRALPRGTRVA